MAFDEDLAERLRIALQGRADVVEKKMFGGLAFLVRGHMAVAASGSGGLMVRCDPEDSARLVAEPGVGPMIMRGRPMDGWLLVDPALLPDDESIARWVAVGTAYTDSLPAKR